MIVLDEYCTRNAVKRGGKKLSAKKVLRKARQAATAYDYHTINGYKVETKISTQ